MNAPGVRNMRPGKSTAPVCQLESRPGVQTKSSSRPDEVGGTIERDGASDRFLRRFLCRMYFHPESMGCVDTYCEFLSSAAAERGRALSILVVMQSWEGLEVLAL